MVTPPDAIESCSPTTLTLPPGYRLIPTSLVHWQNPSDITSYNRPLGHNIGSDEGRLRQDLRDAIKLNTPIDNLALSANYFLRGDTVMANAYADIAVSGRKSYEKLQLMSPTDSNVFDRLDAARSGDAIVGRGAVVVRTPGPAPTEAARWDACHRALDRANSVAWELRRGRRADSPLGYIAVSGEDDMPYRPVNVPGPAEPQYDIAVRVPGFSQQVITRFIIAHALPHAPADVLPNEFRGPRPQDRARNWPSRFTPAIAPQALAADAEVFLYIHGMDSRAEEAIDMIHAFRALGRERRRNYTVIAVDLPGSGYAEKFPHTAVSALVDVGWPNGPLGAHTGFTPTGSVPLLNYIENFVVGFVDALSVQMPPIKSRIKAVMGGSLGGNISLRLGRRMGVPWIQNIVAWSPGSIWGRHPGLTMLPPYHNATHPYTPERRREFFNQAFDADTADFAGIDFIGPQPTTWYRNSWPCKPAAMVADRIDRHETYDDNFRTWHWRLALEQVIYSHQEPDATGKPRYLGNFVNMLLGCGTEDNFAGAHICDNTKTVAEHMTTTPGRGLILKNTGHSIHSERPQYWAQQIVDFLGI